MPIIIVVPDCQFFIFLKIPPHHFPDIFQLWCRDGGRTLPAEAWSQMGWFASHNSHSHSQFIWLLKSQQFTTSTNKHYILSFDLKDVPSAKGRTDTITSTTSHYDFLGQRLEVFAILVFPSDSLRSGWMNYSFSWNELMFTFTWQRFMQNIQNRFVAKPRWESPSSSTSGNGDIFLSHKS